MNGLELAVDDTTTLPVLRHGFKKPSQGLRALERE
jgi:hypothetical protein